MKKILLTIAVVLFSVSQIFSQSFNATVNRSRIALNERLKVDFKLDCEDVNSIGSRKYPQFYNFKVLTGPNTSQSMQIINGKVSASVTYSFILMPQKEGEFVIGSAEVEYAGKAYKTKPIKVRVTKASKNAKRGSSGQITQEQLDKNVFIRAIPSKRKVKKGEQLTVTYKLYTKLNIASPQISKLPDNKGFWAEDLNTSNSINFDYEMYNGERFNSAVIKKVALFPTRTGKLTVTPFELKVPVVIRKKRSSRDVFDDFFNDSFFGRTETIDHVAKSNNLTITVDPLPGNAPEGFTGVVGDFDLKTSIDKRTTKVNDAITITTKISGRGNIKLLSLPKLELPPGFEMYDPKESENISRRGVISGSKTIEYLIVPRIPGKKKIPGITFSFYNPKTNKYETKSSPDFEIEVTGTADKNEISGNGFSKEDVKLLSKDIRFINTSDIELSRQEEFQILTKWFWPLMLVPPFILLIVWAAKKRQDKLSGNVELMKYRKAEKIAKSRLKSADKLLKEEKIDAFSTEVTSAFFGYLEDKLSLSKSSFTIEKAAEELKNRSVADELIQRVKDNIERSEFLRFAPQAESVQLAKEIYENSIKLIVELENSVSSKK